MTWKNCPYNLPIAQVNKESHFFCFIANNIGAGIRHTKTTQEYFAKKVFQYILNHILNPQSEKYWKITDKYNKAHWLQKPINQDISNDSKYDRWCISFINIDFIRDYSVKKRQSLSGIPHKSPKQTKHFFFEKCFNFFITWKSLAQTGQQGGKILFFPLEIGEA